jgi:hypothetical protein
MARSGIDISVLRGGNNYRALMLLLQGRAKMDAIKLPVMGRSAAFPAAGVGCVSPQDVCYGEFKRPR